MCDYSLHHVRSRPARTGDRLVITKFRGSLTRGLAAIDESAVAVCVLPGTELAFDSVVEHATFLRWWLPFIRRKTVGTVARFRQVNVNRPDAHHDALEFEDGAIVLLTSLRRGQRATILQLPKGGLPTKNPGHDGKGQPDQRASLVVGH
jgi:hypothetical protein